MSVLLVLRLAHWCQIYRFKGAIIIHHVLGCYLSLVSSTTQNPSSDHLWQNYISSSNHYLSTIGRENLQYQTKWAIWMFSIYKNLFYVIQRCWNLHKLPILKPIFTALEVNGIQRSETLYCAETRTFMNIHLKFLHTTIPTTFRVLKCNLHGLQSGAHRTHD